jgi:hypothetical protein
MSLSRSLGDAWAAQAVLAPFTAFMKDWDMWRVLVSLNWDGLESCIVQSVILKCWLHHLNPCILSQDLVEVFCLLTWE